MDNPCDRCHQEEGVAWAVWPQIGKRWLCEPCGEVCNKVINAEARRLADKREAARKGDS